MGQQMSVEDRIRQLADDITKCKDDGQTAVLTLELEDAIRQRIIHIRMRDGAIPLWPNHKPDN